MYKAFSRVNFYFPSSFLIIFILKCFLFPSLSTRPEIWAEAGTNFLTHALSDNYWQNIWVTDAGYLPWLQRLIAVIIVKVLHLVESYAIATQLSAIGFIALFCSSINFKSFRQLFSSDLLRFIIGISTAFIPDYEVNTFINFGYYGFIPVFLFLFIDKEKIKNIPFWLISSFLLLVMISKPHYISLTPVILFLTYSAYKKRLYRTCIFYCLALFGFIMQIISLKLHPTIWEKDSTLSEQIGQIIYSSLSMYKHVFIGDYMFASIPTFLLFLLFLTYLFLIFIKKELKTGDKRILYFFIACNVVALTSLAMTITTAKEVFPNEMPFFGVPNDRHFIFTNIAILFAGVVLLQTLIKKKLFLIFTILLLVVNSSAFGYFFNKEIVYVADRKNILNIMSNPYEGYPRSENSYSQWNIYSHLIYKDSYCIPVNPFPLMITKDCTYLNKYNSVSERAVKKDTYQIEASVKNSQMNAIILVNTSKANAFQHLSISAYDNKNRIVGKAVQLTPDSSYDYIYFLFPNPISTPSKIVFLKEGKPYAVTPSILYFGKL